MRRVTGTLLRIAAIPCALGLAMSASSGQASGAKRPVPRPAKSYVLPKVVIETLPNGLRLAVVERHDLPIVAVRTALPALNYIEPAGREGSFAILRAVLGDGTTSRSVDQLAQEFTDLGNTVADTGFTTISSNVAKSLDILADMLMHAALPAAAIERERARRIPAVRTAKTSGNSITSRAIYTTLYGPNHPYARFESEESLRAITRDDLVQLHTAYFRPQNISLAIVGDITPAAARAMVLRAFGGWARGGTTIGNEGPPASVTPPPTAIYLADLPNAPTAYIRMAQLVPARADASVPSLEVMNITYGAPGVTTGRLPTMLRERLGMVYSAQSTFLWRPSPSQSVFYATSSGLAAALADSVLRAWVSELRALKGARPLTESEVQFARSNRTGSLALQLETVPAVASQLADLLRNNLPTDYINRFARSVATMTTADVVAAVKRYIDPDHTAIFVVGDAKVLEPRLRALNLGPVVLIDETGKPR
jgi:zinc protease